MTYLFILGWLGGLVSIIAAAKYARISFFKVSVVHFFILKALVVSFFGYPLLYFHVYDYRVAVGLVDREFIAQAMIASYFAILIPIVVFGVLSAISRPRPVSMASLEYTRSTNRKTLLWYWGAVVVCVALALLEYLSRVPSVALFQALTGGDVSLARSQMTNDFPGTYHWFRLAFHDVAGLASLVFFAYSLSHGSTKSWVLFLVAFSVTSFALVMSAQKAPMAWFLVALTFVYLLVRKRGVIKLRHVFFLLGLVVVSLVPVYILFIGSDSAWSALYAISSRAFTGQLSGAYNYQWVFPDNVDYLMGRSLPNPARIFPFEHYRLTVEVMDIVRPELSERGVVGSQPTIYWAEAYANFGWTAVPLAAVYVGFFLFAVAAIIGRINSLEVRSAATVWVGLHISTFANSGFSWSLLPVTLVSLLLIIFIHESIAKGLGSLR